MSGGEVIANRYEIRDLLGTGSGGAVYRAFDRLIERIVALKLFNLPPPDDTFSREAHARFRQGAKAAGRLAHPNIVAVHDYGEDNSRAWIVMELVEGESLKQMLDRGEKLPIERAVRIAVDLLHALAYSHQRGVVHRDIKPANVMIAPDGSAKIADFGIARLENSSITHAGTIMGTPAYMAPEQIRSEPNVDHRADIWAAGIVLYEMLAGEKPFDGSITSIMQKALFTEPLPPSLCGRAVPPAFDAVVARAMAKRPEDRFGSAAEMLAALRDAVAATAAGGTMALPRPIPPSNGLAGRRPAPGEETTIIADRRAALAAQHPSLPFDRSGPGVAPPLPRTADPKTEPRPLLREPKRSRMPLLLGAAVVALAGLATGAFLLLDGELPGFATASSGGAEPPGPVAAAQPSSLAAAAVAPGGEAAAQPEAAVVAPPPPLTGGGEPGQGGAPPPTEPPSAAASAPTTPPPEATMAQGGAPRPDVTPPRPGSGTGGVGAAPPPPSPPAPEIPRIDFARLGSIAARSVICGIVHASGDGSGLTITGIARRDEAERVRRTLESFRLPPGSARVEIAEFDSQQFCDVLAAIRPYAEQNAPLHASLTGETPLRGGQALGFEVRTPDWQSRLHVTYLSVTGDAIHLVSGPTLYQPGGTIAFGGEGRWKIDAPYGTDLLLAVASTAPLFGARRRSSEPIESFTPGLSTALRAMVDQPGNRVSVAVVPVRTAAP